jgi:hypothetical protein
VLLCAGINYVSYVKFYPVATGYGLDDRVSGVRFPVGAGNFSLLRRVQTGSGIHPVSYLMCNWGSSHGGQSDRGMKLTIHLLLVLRSKMRGATPPPPKRIHGVVFTFTGYI